jgi:hypothetical protein
MCPIFSDSPFQRRTQASRIDRQLDRQFRSQLAELTPNEKKLTDQKFYKWAVEHSPLRLRQIEGHLTGRPSAARVISERLWDTPDLSWQRWTRKDAVHVGVPIVTGEPHQHHASA